MADVGLAGDTVALRRRLLGDVVDERTGAVAPDAVSVAWLGVSTFVVAVAGRVLLLDAWIPRGTVAPRVPLAPDDLPRLRPDAVLVGHGHLDHAADVPRVLARSDALLVAAPEHARSVGGALRGQGWRYRPAVAPDAPTGTRTDHELFDGLELTVVVHVHSRPVAPRGRRRTIAPRPDPSPCWHAPPRPRDVGHLLRHATDACGPCLLYQLRTEGFALTWHDTSGPLPERAPTVPDLLGELPPTDVHLPAVSGFGQLTNGLDDVRRYVAAVGARVLVPTHHDHWLPPLTAPGQAYRPHVDEVLQRLPAGQRPELVFLTDPDDYARPVGFAADA